MIERFEKHLTLLEKNITILFGRTDCGIDVLITGGDQSHIGAISIVDPKGQTDTKVFEDHKDQFISEEWAKALYELYQVPVVVSVGIHYDNIDANGIRCVIDTLRKKLEDILENT